MAPQTELDAASTKSPSISTSASAAVLVKDLACFERSSAIDPDEEEKIRAELLSSGVDLREFSQSIESSLADAERGGLDAYIHEAHNLRQFHSSVVECDDILKTMNTMLQTFQDRLSNISAEIQHLQKQSVNMSIKLKNRQAVRGELSQYINELVVPETMIVHILDTPVTDRGFVEQLHELNHKLNFSKQQAFQDARSAQDVRDALEKLRMRARAKLREYLLQRVQQFKKPLVNYQMAQNALLKYRFFYEFLLNNEREIAREVLDEYADTIGKVYYAYFKTYISKLAKLENESVPSKDDMVGIDAEHAAKKAFSFASILNPSQAALNMTSTLSSAFSAATSTSSSTPSSAGGKTSVFSLCGRDSILHAGIFDGPVLIPHVAETESSSSHSDNNKRYSHEVIFRSLHYALVDNAVREYFFLSDFFLLTGRAVADLFNSIWAKTFQTITKSTEEYAATSYDAIGLMLCVQMCTKLQQQHTKSKDVDIMDYYFSNQIHMLLPRLQHVIFAHVESLQHVDAHNMQVDLTPHYMPRRCAEFLASLFVIRMLVGPNEHDDLFSAMMQRLKQEMDGLLLRMAAEFSERRHQLVFLINNYDLLCSVMAERLSAVNRTLQSSNNNNNINSASNAAAVNALSASSAAAAVSAPDERELQSIRDQLNLRMKEYMEEMLSHFFGPLVDFVKTAERQLQQQNNASSIAHSSRPLAAPQAGTVAAPARPATIAIKVDKEKILRIISSFNASWKKAVEDMNAEIMKQFSNFKVGTSISQMTLTQLMQYYHRFHVVLSTPPFNETGAVKELFNVHQLMVELKKYKLAQF